VATSAPATAGWAPALPPAALPPLEGALAWSPEGLLQGWLRDPALPLWPVPFALMLGGTCLGRHGATQPLAGEGPLRHGFSLRLPPEIGAAMPARIGELRLVHLGTGRSLRATEPVRPRIQIVPGTESTPPRPPVPAEPSPAPAAEVPPGGEALRQAVEAAFRAENWPEVLRLTAPGLGGAALATLGRRADHRLVAWRGRAQLYLRDFAEAAQTLAWFEAHMPGQHNALFYRAQALTGMQRLEEAHRVFGACLAARPEEARYVLEAARVAARLVNGDYGALEPYPELLPEALDLLRRAIALRPQDPRPQRELGHLLLQFDDPEAGLAALQQAAALAPAQAVAQLDLARALTRLGRVEAALAAARAALALEPQRDGAAFAVRLLERWVEARRTGPFHLGALGGES